MSEPWSDASEALSLFGIAFSSLSSLRFHDRLRIDNQPVSSLPFNLSPLTASYVFAAFGSISDKLHPKLPEVVVGYPPPHTVSLAMLILLLPRLVVNEHFQTSVTTIN